MSAINTRQRKQGNREQIKTNSRRCYARNCGAKKQFAWEREGGHENILDVEDMCIFLIALYCFFKDCIVLY